MTDIHNQDFYESEYNDAWANAIERSKYTTKESLAKMLEAHYHALEIFQEFFDDAHDHWKNLLHLSIHYKKKFLEDEENFFLWRLSLEEIQEKIADIESDLDYFIIIYQEITSKFEYAIELFDEPRDKILYKIKYEQSLQNFFNIHCNIENTYKKYGSLIGYNEDNE